ncbi:MAG: hypothetical protein D8M61_20855 [Ignavibacteriae bacterium]|nr:hypothetical protein [Ignavibacteriota bacterium]
MNIKMLFDQPIIGESQYGKYFLYAVRNGDGNEYSLFAPEEVHEKLKDLKQGEEAVLTKLAAQRGKKLVTTYDVKVVGNKSENVMDNSKGSSMHNQNNNNDSSYYQAMSDSFKEALRLQEKYNSVNLNQIAITLFIQRTKANGL